MPGAELMDSVRTLRSQGYSPKQIARSLGLPPATVIPLIRAVAAETDAARRAGGEPELAVAGCWVSPGWAAGLTVRGAPPWPGLADSGELSGSGMVTVVIARELRGSKVSACCFLVDTYCLGVKSVIGPLVKDRRKLAYLVHQAFSSYDASPLEAPEELARHLVFGAVAYARGLGFEPCADFDACAGHLGEWGGSSRIEFGYNGRPFYIQGPYDDAAKVMRTLAKSGASDAFHHLVPA